MTPSEILDSVKAQFQVLYVDNPAQLDSLLTLTLSEYQSRAGIVRDFEITELENLDVGASIPADFSSILSGEDAESVWTEIKVISGKAKAVTDKYSTPPFRCFYSVDLTKVDFETYDLPSEAMQPIHRYLKLMVEIPNNKQEKLVCEASGLPVDHLPAESELIERLNVVRDQMKENNSFIPSMMIL